MNKIAIIAGICGFAAGATGGYFACHFIEQKKIDKAISDGIQQTLEEIRDNQREKVMENEKRKSNIINAIPHFTAVDIAKDIAKENGYVKEAEEKDSKDSKDSKEDVKEPEDAPDDDLPFEIGERDMELYNHNIWDDDEPDKDSITQEEYDAEQEPEVSIDISKLDPTKKPYPITKEQYDDELTDATSEGQWDKVELIFFTDNVFAERASFNEFTMMSSTEIELAIGKDNMKRFIEDRSLGLAFVRNNKLHIDYMITRSPRSYSSALHEDDEE